MLNWSNIGAFRIVRARSDWEVWHGKALVAVFDTCQEAENYARILGTALEWREDDGKETEPGH